MSSNATPQSFAGRRAAVGRYRGRLWWGGVVLPIMAGLLASADVFDSRNLVGRGVWWWPTLPAAAFGVALAGASVFMVRNRHRRRRPVAAFMAGGALAVCAFSAGLTLPWSLMLLYGAFPLIPIAFAPVFGMATAYSSLRRLTRIRRNVRMGSLALGVGGFLAGSAVMIAPELAVERFRTLMFDAAGGDDAAFQALALPRYAPWLDDATKGCPPRGLWSNHYTLQGVQVAEIVAAVRGGPRPRSYAAPRRYTPYERLLQFSSLAGLASVPLIALLHFVVRRLRRVVVKRTR